MQSKKTKKTNQYKNKATSTRFELYIHVHSMHVTDFSFGVPTLRVELSWSMDPYFCCCPQKLILLESTPPVYTLDFCGLSMRCYIDALRKASGPSGSFLSLYRLSSPPPNISVIATLCKWLIRLVFREGPQGPLNWPPEVADICRLSNTQF